VTTEPLLSTSEAARLLDVSDETLRRWTKEGLIRHVRMPSGRPRYRRSDVLELLTPIEPVNEASA